MAAPQFRFSVQLLLAAGVVGACTSVALWITDNEEARQIIREQNKNGPKTSMRYATPSANKPGSTFGSE